MNAAIRFTQEELTYIRHLVYTTSIINKVDIFSNRNIGILGMLQDDVSKDLSKSIGYKIIKIEFENENQGIKR